MQCPACASLPCLIILFCVSVLDWRTVGSHKWCGRPDLARCRCAFCVCIMCVECVGNFVSHVCACLACDLSETCLRLCRLCVVVCCSTLASGVGDLTGYAAGTLIVCVSCVWGVWATLYAMFVLALRAPRQTHVCFCAGGSFSISSASRSCFGCESCALLSLGTVSTSPFVGEPQFITSLYTLSNPP